MIANKKIVHFQWPHQKVASINFPKPTEHMREPVQVMIQATHGTGLWSVLTLVRLTLEAQNTICVINRSRVETTNTDTDFLYLRKCFPEKTRMFYGASPETFPKNSQLQIRKNTVRLLVLPNVLRMFPDTKLISHINLINFVKDAIWTFTRNWWLHFARNCKKNKKCFDLYMEIWNAGHHDDHENSGVSMRL